MGPIVRADGMGQPFEPDGMGQPFENDKLDRIMSKQENEVLFAIYLYGAT